MRKGIIVFLIITLCFILVPQNTSAITLGEYEAKVQKYVNEANANQAAINKTQAEINATNNEIANIKTEMTNLSNEIVKLRNDIVEYNKEIKEKSLQTKELFEYFQMANGENNYFEYIFGAETITDLIYRMKIVEQMTEYNNKVTKELEEMIEKNKQREKEIAVKEKELQAKQKEMEQKLISLGNKKQDLVEGGASIQQQIKIYQERVQYYKNKGCLSHHVIGVDCDTGASAGIFRRPTSTGYITSEFGGRWGSFHRGLDISSYNPYSTKIYPVANGKISSIYKDVYGALVLVIEHYDDMTGKYYSSLYAHMSSYAPGLYVGKYVSSDDYIGYMGSTGYSFGPHLHLEIGACRLYTDSECYNLTSYMNFVREQGQSGAFKGPRQLINFPSGLYNPWYNR